MDTKLTTDNLQLTINKKGWELKKLVDVCIVERGSSPRPIKDFITDDKDGVNWIKIGDTKNIEKYIYTTKQKITKKGAEKSRFVEEGDFILSNSMSFGKPYIIKTKGYIHDGWFKLKLHDFIDTEYFYQLLSSPYVNDQFHNLASGSVVKNISGDLVKKVVLPIPPLPEQKRIVSILDKAFEAIDKAKANTEQNLKNAKEVFESYLNRIFEEKGEDWEEKELGEIADVEYGYTDKSSHQGDYRYIRITDIDKNGELILESKKYIPKSKESEKFIVNNNDLLMARTGATFAKVLLYKDYEPSVFASYLIKISFKKNIENEFYWYFTKTNYYWEQANLLSSGAAQPHFNGKALKQVLFSYPKSANEQKNIIKRFQIFTVETKKLESIYQKKIEDLEELKKSVLQKAFRGELIEKEIIV